MYFRFDVNFLSAVNVTKIYAVGASYRLRNFAFTLLDAQGAVVWSLANAGDPTTDVQALPPAPRGARTDGAACRRQSPAVLRHGGHHVPKNCGVITRPTPNQRSACRSRHTALMV